MVSDSFARRYWPGESPLGHHFKFAYYDRTNQALKFAHHLGGSSWDITTVDSKARSDVGRYAKLIAQNGGWVIESDAGGNLAGLNDLKQWH